MFSKGQITFGILFFIAFVIMMVILYRKDLAMHKVYYKGVFKILLGFLGFLVLLFIIKLFFK